MNHSMLFVVLFSCFASSFLWFHSPIFASIRFINCI